MLVKLALKVDLNNMFTQSSQKSKNSIKLSELYCAFERSVLAKALRKMLMKLTPGFRGLKNNSLDMVSYRNDTYEKEDIFSPKLLDRLKVTSNSRACIFYPNICNK